MSASLAARKAVELDHKLSSLEAELEHWERQSVAGGPLEKHHTQIRAVAGQLAVPTGELREHLAEIDALAGAAEAEGMILDLHRIWDVFRGKLALRCVEHFAGYLLGADELAYRCYRPAELRGAPREPPLAFFGDDLSPVTHLREPLRRLPVPLIGLPWFQLEHLPDAPIIAHEVGHAVEGDLELGPVLDAAVDGALLAAGAGAEHRRAWACWREEAFADVYGTLALGPAFTRTLIDFLAAEPRVIAGQWQADPGWSAHPPSTLRVRLSAAVLERTGFAAEAARAREEWSRAYPRHPMQCFEADVAVVAAALADGDPALAELVTFTPEAHERAARDARSVLKRVGARGTDARELVSAARLAFDDAPDRFRAADVSAKLLRRIRDGQTVGVRAGTASPVTASLRDARALAAGTWLNDHLKERHVQAQHA